MLVRHVLYPAELTSLVKPLNGRPMNWPMVDMAPVPINYLIKLFILIIFICIFYGLILLFYALLKNLNIPASPFDLLMSFGFSTLVVFSVFLVLVS